MGKAKEEQRFFQKSAPRSALLLCFPKSRERGAGFQLVTKKRSLGVAETAL